MSAPILRILSDLHYGDRASRVRRLAALRPLFEGADSLLLNGDSLDTRPGPDPQGTRALKAQVEAFLREQAPPVRLHTGNHDPDISAHHHADLADGRVLVTHGDILFDSLVPWGRDAPAIRRDLRRAWAACPERGPGALEGRLRATRAVAATVSQRHQSERRPLQYALHLAADTVWPPHRVFLVLQAWSRAPGLAHALARLHRPQAEVIIFGHTHRPGLWLRPDGRRVINTGSFCPPLGSLAVDLCGESLSVRPIGERGGEFRLGPPQASFCLGNA